MKDKCVDFVLMISIVFSDKFPASPGSGLTLTPGPVCGDCSSNQNQSSVGVCLSVSRSWFGI